MQSFGSVSPRSVELPARVVQLPSREIVVPAREIEVIGDDGQPTKVTIPERIVTIPGQEVEVPGRQIGLDGGHQEPQMMQQQRQIVHQPMQQEVVYQQPMQQEVIYQQPMQQQVVYQQPAPQPIMREVVYQQPVQQQYVLETRQVLVSEPQQFQPAVHNETQTLGQTRSWSPTRSTGGKKYPPIVAPEPIEYDINEVRAATHMYNINNNIRSVDTHGDYSYLTSGRLSPGGSVYDSVQKTGTFSR